MILSFHCRKPSAVADIPLLYENIWGSFCIVFLIPCSLFPELQKGSHILFEKSSPYFHKGRKDCSVWQEGSFYRFVAAVGRETMNALNQIQ